MNWTVIATYAKGVWAAVGPLVGVLVGAYIANRNQRKEWVADNKKQEYRELVSILTRALNSVMLESAVLVAHSPEEQREFERIGNEVLITIRDRLFIEDVVTKLRVYERWRQALADFRGVRQRQVLIDKVEEIKSDLRKAAATLFS
ncbi:MAG TPA: hypothetical protein VOA88_15760 [Candidatus Dormibacteraeota bacterium]|nr:hypothetical protein [Candidatus Dormibacteraeota bacterium]